MRTYTADHCSFPKPDSFRPSATRIDLSIAGLWGFFCLGTSQPVLTNEASPTPTPGVIIAEHIRTAVIDAAAKALEDKYVFPDVGKQMADKIRQDNASKSYDTITTGEDLSHRLTEDLYGVAHDRHPITKTSWEGVGVQPDVAVPADKALDMAHYLALKKLTSQLLCIRFNHHSSFLF